MLVLHAGISVTPCGIMVDKSNLGAGFSEGSLVFLCLKYHSFTFSINISFISTHHPPCDGASNLVNQYPCLLQSLIKGLQKVTGSYHTYLIPGKTSALVPEFAGKTCLRQNCSLGSCTCSEVPVLGQNTLNDNELRGFT